MANPNFESFQEKKDFKSNNNYEKTNFRGKFASNKEGGGFRIRLSDNEMKAVKSIQENFQLKSTVAVLGFSVRTLSELIKDSDLKEKISTYAQNNRNPEKRFNSSNKNEAIKDKRPDPFARPTKSISEEKIDHQDKEVNE
tara:strand:+ start:156 stop:575 length:420 start_codon:yes stop_codon:yes gene_type:complete